MSHATQEAQNIFPKAYKDFLKEIKDRILTCQIKAAVAINKELISLCWEIGSKIHAKQKSEGWGAKTIENLAKDLKSSFPDMKGFSLTNIKYMVQFAKEYPDAIISQQLPSPQSDLANQTLKDPYCFDFLTLRAKFDEQELEQGLLAHY